MGGLKFYDTGSKFSRIEKKTFFFCTKRKCGTPVNFQKTDSVNSPHARDTISSKYCVWAEMRNNEYCLCGLNLAILLSYTTWKLY